MHLILIFHCSLENSRIAIIMRIMYLFPLDRKYFINHTSSRYLRGSLKNSSSAISTCAAHHFMKVFPEFLHDVQ